MFCRRLNVTTGLVFFSFFSFSVYSQNSSTFSTPGTYTWTCPAGVTTINVDLYGAGGGGGKHLVLKAIMVMEVSENVYLISNSN